MKKLTANIKSILLCRKGESLMESIASLFLFLILLMAITTMIRTALHITSEYTKDAARRQDVVNAAVMESYSASPASGTLSLETGDGKIIVTIPVELFDGAGDYADDYVAFRPEP